MISAKWQPAVSLQQPTAKRIREHRNYPHICFKLQIRQFCFSACCCYMVGQKVELSAELWQNIYTQIYISVEKFPKINGCISCIIVALLFFCCCCSIPFFMTILGCFPRFDGPIVLVLNLKERIKQKNHMLSDCVGIFHFVRKKIIIQMHLPRSQIGSCVVNNVAAMKIATCVFEYLKNHQIIVNGPFFVWFFFPS